MISYGEVPVIVHTISMLTQPLVNTTRAAELLAVTPRMIRKLTQRGELAKRHIGSAVRYDVADLARLVGLDK